ncbi:MAG: 1,4-alpha-glucan branching enzyme, partial [Cyanobacteria bacterium P01_A01_bin.135]
MTMTVAPDQIDRIVWNQHQNPFEVLGPHKIDDDGKTTWVIRAFLPNAQEAWVIRPESIEDHPMTSVHHPNFFECQLETPDLSGYQLRIKEGDHERVIYDPYAFQSPQITDFDVHLFGEGNHHRIYEKMGAHPATIDRVSGVCFAVWAPNARNVSLLGDFNNWDGRK